MKKFQTQGDNYTVYGIDRGWMCVCMWGDRGWMCVRMWGDRGWMCVYVGVSIACKNMT